MDDRTVDLSPGAVQMGIGTHEAQFTAVRTETRVLLKKLGLSPKSRTDIRSGRVIVKALKIPFSRLNPLKPCKIILLWT